MTKKLIDPRDHVQKFKIVGWAVIVIGLVSSAIPFFVYDGGARFSGVGLGILGIVVGFFLFGVARRNQNSTKG